MSPHKDVAVAEMVIEKAKRLTEHKKDVVIFQTRYDLEEPIMQWSKFWKSLTGGVDANALQRALRFLELLVILVDL